MHLKPIIGIVIAFMIGLACSVLTIPVPAPPLLSGAMLVVAMTSGYLLADRYLANHETAQAGQSTNTGTGEDS
ncbi:MAG: DUF1427 family protein [Pseudomonadota bacterium]